MTVGICATVHLTQHQSTNNKFGLMLGEGWVAVAHILILIHSYCDSDGYRVKRPLLRARWNEGGTRERWKIGMRFVKDYFFKNFRNS